MSTAARCPVRLIAWSVLTSGGRPAIDCGSSAGNSTVPSKKTPRGECRRSAFAKPCDRWSEFRLAVLEACVSRRGAGSGALSALPRLQLESTGLHPAHSLQRLPPPLSCTPRAWGKVKIGRTIGVGTVLRLPSAPPQPFACQEVHQCRGSADGPHRKIFTGCRTAADWFVLRSERTSNSHIFGREPCGYLCLVYCTEDSCP